jgi:8-oxo-dGTP diphosphatase
LGGADDLDAGDQGVDECLDGRVSASRRQCLLQARPLGVRPEESAGEAAVREAGEETGLMVAETKMLGERVHPATGRTMVYVACEVVSGDATVVDDEELVELAWTELAQLAEYVPYGFFEPVQQHLDDALKA